MADFEPKRLLLVHAALSHVELAVANMKSQADRLQEKDHEVLCSLAEELQELVRAQKMQRPRSNFDHDVQDSEMRRSPLVEKVCVPDSLLAAPPPELDLATWGQAQEPTTQSVGRDGEQLSDKSPSEERKLQRWLTQLMDIFDQIDADKTGAVEWGEWKNAMGLVGVPLELAEELFNFADTDKHGTIDRLAWLHMLQGVQEGSAPQMLIQFSNALSKLQSKNGRIYLPMAPPKYRFVIRPDSPARTVWDLSLMVLLFYIALMLPYTMGFDQNNSTLENIARGIDGFFLVDVVLNFRTAYISHDILVMDSRRITWYYLRTWFLLDFLTCFPFDLASAGLFPNLQPAKLMKIGKVFKACKLLKLTKVKTMFQDSDMMDSIDDKTMGSGYQTFSAVMQMIFLLAVACHWLACFMSVSGQNWRQESGETELTYSSAIYWAMTTLTTVGYGDIIPMNDTERAYSTIAMVIGGSFYGYMVGRIGSTIAARDRNAAAYTERMEQVRSWLYYHSELPVTLRRRVKRYFQRHLTETAAVDDTAIISDLSPALVHDVSFFLIHEQVRSNVLFHNLPNSALAQLIPALERKESEPNDHIVTFGEPGTAMYIIIEGVAIFDAGHLWTSEDQQEVDPMQCAPEQKEYKQSLTVGDSFGEEVILGLEQEYHYTIHAQTSVKMFAISEEAFLHAFSHMVDIQHKMHENFIRNRKPSGHDDGQAIATASRASLDTVLVALKDIRQSCSATETKLDAFAQTRGSDITKPPNSPSQENGLPDPFCGKGLPVQETAQPRDSLPVALRDQGDEQAAIATDSKVFDAL